MKTILRLLLILSVAIAPACIEIEEEISLNKDGSGSYRMIVDMNEIMEMIQGMMSEEDGDVGNLSQMDSTMQASAEQLRQIEGISKVKSSVEGYRFTIGYDFASVEALNQAHGEGRSFSALGEGLNMGIGDGSNGTDYSLKKRAFSRQNVPMEDMMAELEEAEEGSLEMLKMFMGDATYKMTYHMPGRVKSTTNVLSEVSEDRKTVITEIPMLDWLEGNADIGNTIKYKKR